MLDTLLKEDNMAEEEVGKGQWYNKKHEKLYKNFERNKMIIELTKDQITILVFAMRLYADKVYEQNIIIPTDMEHSGKVVKEILDAFTAAKVV